MAMAKKSEDYNWIDDPFNDKKNEEFEHQGMSTGAKAFVGIAIFVVVVLIFLGMGGMLEALSMLAA